MRNRPHLDVMGLTRHLVCESWAAFHGKAQEASIRRHFSLLLLHLAQLPTFTFMQIILASASVDPEAKMVNIKVRIILSKKERADAQVPLEVGSSCPNHEACVKDSQTWHLLETNYARNVDSSSLLRPWVPSDEPAGEIW